MHRRLKTWTYCLLEKLQDKAQQLTENPGAELKIPVQIRGPYGSPFTGCISDRYTSSVLIGCVSSMAPTHTLHSHSDPTAPQINGLSVPICATRYNHILTPQRNMWTFCWCGCIVCASSRPRMELENRFMPLKKEMEIAVLACAVFVYLCFYSVLWGSL